MFDGYEIVGEVLEKVDHVKYALQNYWVHWQHKTNLFLIFDKRMQYGLESSCSLYRLLCRLDFSKNTRILLFCFPFLGCRWFLEDFFLRPKHLRSSLKNH